MTKSDKLQQQLDTLKNLAKLAEKYFCRIPVILSGESTFKAQLIETFLNEHEKEKIAWLSNDTQNSYQDIQHFKAVNVIGKEYQFIIYDIEHKFDPNLFAALAGTLKGGGLLIVLTPPLTEWQTKCQSDNDWFMWRFIEKFIMSPLAIKLDINDSIESLDTSHLKLEKPKATEHLIEQQNIAIEKILHVVTGHRNRPLVLLADRGRGKSAALGIATSQLLKKQDTKIIITAPSLDACSIVFKHVKINLPNATSNNGNVKFYSSSLKFIPPDKLSISENKANLLIIDEASGIPPSILEKLLNKYSRIVFASTIHGYEGSGHCFSIKFFKHLDKITPNWKKFLLEPPIRWNNSDPLETLLNQAFLLKPNHETIIEKPVLDNISIEKISTQSLIKNESLLAEFYNLLSSAHYKTQPSDLKQIVNNVDINIFIAKNNSTLIAAAFTIKEGCLDKEISEQIYLGNRRPKGHITPQSLLLHLGIQNAGDFSYLRIMRLAVRPEIQNQGVGSMLVKHIQNEAKKQKIDFISCSFGSSQELLNFWGKHKFSLIRIGHHKKSQINAYAALMIQPVSEASNTIHDEALTHFKDNFCYLLRENLNDIDSDICLKILKDFTPLIENKLSEKEISSLRTYVEHNKSYEDNIKSIYMFSYLSLCKSSTHEKLTKNELNLILLKTMYGKSWESVSEQLNFTGKSQTNIEFKNIISKLLNNL